MHATLVFISTDSYDVRTGSTSTWKLMQGVGRLPQRNIFSIWWVASFILDKV